MLGCIFGVLQRIALCYFFASVLLHYLSKKQVIWFAVLSLIAYNLILVLFGDLTLEGNAVLKLDKWLIGESHMYHGEGIAFDPEGLLSTLPAISNVIAGYLAGLFIQKKGQDFEAVAKLMLAGFALILIALSWDLFFPINKKLWTSSFVLLTSGIDLIAIAALVYLLDMKKTTGWTYFFEVLGRFWGGFEPGTFRSQVGSTASWAGWPTRSPVTVLRDLGVGCRNSGWSTFQ